MSSPVLRCEGLVAGRDGRVVVHGLDLAVARGDIVALLGANGAGKTTTLLTIAGLLAPLGGGLFYDDRPITGRRPHRYVRDGLVLVPDDRGLFPGLTVRQHLDLAKRPGNLAVDEILDRFPALRRRLDTAAGSLSGGEQQMLAVGRALIQRPTVLLVDELSLGLAPMVVHQILPAIAASAKEDGMAVVLVEQHVSLALEVADRALVLSHGSVVLSEEAQALRADAQRLEAAYFAGTPDGSSVRA